MLMHSNMKFGMNVKKVEVPLMQIPAYAREGAECKPVYGINVDAIILCN
jgi:hypothetical protein